MRILFCCEFYTPSVGGVQEVIKQIAERLVSRGHDVTVATTKLPSRSVNVINGVKIREFEVSGNLVCGLKGELDAYRHFVASGDFDVIMIKAAQQWTFDALWPVLSRVKAGKVLVPCGFSCLYHPSYADYYRRMPGILRRFDHLIFYASHYRDINFTREHGIENFSVIPNGASEEEFSAAANPRFRASHGIGADDFLFLTVGSFTGLKGHMEIADAFARAELDSPAVLILNGNEVSAPAGKDLRAKLKKHVKSRLKSIGIIKDKKDQLLEFTKKINAQQENKKVLITDLTRHELIQAFMAADLFVFASNIEYSPLVLFESAAAGTAFLSVPAGNAEEIAFWTGGGEICPASVDKRGYTRVDPEVLAEHMSKLARDRNHLAYLGATGKKNWAGKFTWDKIVFEYEKVFREVIQDNRG